MTNLKTAIDMIKSDVSDGHIFVTDETDNAVILRKTLKEGYAWFSSNYLGKLKPLGTVSDVEAHYDGVETRLFITLQKKKTVAKRFFSEVEA